MRFIIDAQLPRKLAFLFEEAGYNALHTLDLPSQNLTKDKDINQLSMDEKRVVISKDLDFRGALYRILAYFR